MYISFKSLDNIYRIVYNIYRNKEARELRKEKKKMETLPTLMEILTTPKGTEVLAMVICSFIALLEIASIPFIAFIGYTMIKDHFTNK